MAARSKMKGPHQVGCAEVIGVGCGWLMVLVFIIFIVLMALS